MAVEREEVQIGITSLVAGLGLWKTQELVDFIASIKNVNLKTHDYMHLTISFAGFIFYVGYLGCVGASLYFIYKKDAEKHSRSILFAVCLYFMLQILLILIVWNNATAPVVPKALTVIPTLPHCIVTAICPA